MATATYIVAGLVAAGGLFGYLKTGSVISVVMASAFGVGLAYAGSLISNPATARSGTQLAFGSCRLLACSVIVAVVVWRPCIDTMLLVGCSDQPRARRCHGRQVCVCSSTRSRTRANEYSK